MKGIFCLIALCLTACGGSDSASIPLSATETPQAKTAVVFIGDSITASWGDLPNWVVNAGESGQVSAQMLDRFEADVMARNPAVVEILAGTNDVRTWVTPSIDGIASMAERAQGSGACVIIGTVPPNSIWGVNSDITNTSGNAEILVFNEQLRMLARAYGISIADYHSVLVLPDGTIDQSLFTDGIHPNVDGHAKMWTVVSPLVDKCIHGS